MNCNLYLGSLQACLNPSLGPGIVASVSKILSKGTTVP